MRLSERQDQLSPGRLPAGTAGCAPPASAEGAQGVAVRFVRLAGPVLRSPAGVMIAVASFAVAGAAGGRTGLAMASGYTGTEAAVYLVVLGAGYALEWAVAARTGRRVLR